MTSQILVLSDKQNDIDFWKKIAHHEGLHFKNSVAMEEISQILQERPDSLILWDAECENLRGVEQVFLKMGLTSQVLVVTETAVRGYPHLFLPPSFSHHLYRRYTGNAEFLCTQLVKKSIATTQSGFEDYFTDIIARKSMVITRTTQKRDVIDVFSQFMLDHQVLGRIADIASDAIDELLMNAIFDAPQDDNGNRYRRKFLRDADFELVGKETVTAELVISSDLVGIRVIDQFGSLKSDSAVRCLGKNFDDAGYVISHADPGAGLGLLKLMQSAMSLVFLVEPGVRTESIALLRNTRHFRDLRTSFSFFSIHSDAKLEIHLK